MKIKLTTVLGKTYNIMVKEKDFNNVVKKIMEKQYIELDDNTIITTNTISEIKKEGK